MSKTNKASRRRPMEGVVIRDGTEKQPLAVAALSGPAKFIAELIDHCDRMERRVSNEWFDEDVTTERSDMLWGEMQAYRRIRAKMKRLRKAIIINTGESRMDEPNGRPG